MSTGPCRTSAPAAIGEVRSVPRGAITSTGVVCLRRNSSHWAGTQFPGGSANAPTAVRFGNVAARAAAPASRTPTTMSRLPTSPSITSGMHRRPVPRRRSRRRGRPLPGSRACSTSLARPSTDWRQPGATRLETHVLVGMTAGRRGRAGRASRHYFPHKCIPLRSGTPRGQTRMLAASLRYSSEKRQAYSKGAFWR